MLEIPSDHVRVSTSLPTTSPSSCSAAAHVADSGLSVKRESSVECKCPSSWRERWGSRRMAKIQITMLEGATRGTRWDIVHSRDRALTPKLARLCPGSSTTGYHTLYTRSPPQARAIKLRIALVLVEWSHAGGGETNIDLGQYWSLAAWPACIPLQRTHQELYSVPKDADKQPLTTVVNQLCKLNIMNCKISKKVYK